MFVQCQSPSAISDLPQGSRIRIQTADLEGIQYAAWHGYWTESANPHGLAIMRRDWPSGTFVGDKPPPPRFSVEILQTNQAAE